nr:tetratricopeptide repeat protein [uncultured Psychroserpens sp.]
MSLEDDILIDNFLRGLLDENEQANFNARLQTDVDFKASFELEQALWLSQSNTDWSFVKEQSEAVNVYKKLLDEDHNLQNLKKTLNLANLEFKERPAKKKSFNFYYLTAACILILISLSLFFNQNISNQELVNDYLNTSNLPSFVSRGDASTDDLIKAQKFFENEEYQKSLDIFETALKTSGVNASVYLYSGIAQMKLKQYNAAELTFNKLIESNLLDAQKGFWYKALLYLEQDKVEDAKTILNSIVSKSLYNHTNAKELLNQLNDD